MPFSKLTEGNLLLDNSTRGMARCDTALWWYGQPLFFGYYVNNDNADKTPGQ